MKLTDHFKRPLVISFLQEKGGAGKTTLATNVARGFQLLGLKVLLVDGDPQGSARDWNAENGGTLVPVIGLDRETLPVDIKAVLDGYHIVVIDGAPQLTKLSAAAIRASDIVLIPVQPSPYDVWASADLVELVKCRQDMTGKPEAAFVVSRAIKNTKLSQEVTDSLKEYGLPVFQFGTTQCVAYPTSAASGLSVFEFKNIDRPAQLEIHNVISEIMERYVYGTQSKKENSII